jgi:hypothetical protein
MKALLAVIASLSIFPAYAFENLIVDSTFQHPVVLSGNLQGNAWTNVASSPSVPSSSGSIGAIAAAATTVVVAVPNPFVGASTAGSTINLPGNSGSQLVTTTFSVPPITPNVSQPSLVAPNVAVPNSPNIAAVAPAAAVPVSNPSTGAPANVPQMSANISQTLSSAPTGLAVAFNSPNNLSGPGPSGPAGAKASRKINEVGSAFLVGKIQAGSAGTTNSLGAGGGAGNADGGGGEKGGGGGGGAGTTSSGTFNITDVFFGGNGGKGGGGARSVNGVATHGVPGPEAGAGQPILILLGCIAFGVMRKRWMGA